MSKIDHQVPWQGESTVKPDTSNPTPNGTRIFAQKADGTTEDVTESVQALYDLVLQSMDWGSGFFSAEEAEPVARIGRICGFEEAPEAERYLAEAQRQEAAKHAREVAFVRRHRIANPNAQPEAWNERLWDEAGETLSPEDILMHVALQDDKRAHAVQVTRDFRRGFPGSPKPDATAQENQSRRGVDHGCYECH